MSQDYQKSLAFKNNLDDLTKEINNNNNLKQTEKQIIIDAITKFKNEVYKAKALIKTKDTKKAHFLEYIINEFEYQMCDQTIECQELDILYKQNHLLYTAFADELNDYTAKNIYSNALSAYKLVEQNLTLKELEQKATELVSLGMMF